MNEMSNAEPLFEQLEPRILLSGSPAPDVSTDTAVVADVNNQHETAADLEVTEILFVDSNVKNYDQLISSLNRNVEVHIIDANEDGLQFISAKLAGREGLSAIHIISHGDEGSISLGNSELNSGNLDSSKDLLNSWSNSLTDSADILIYGCEVAQDTDFINRIAEFTGADVAASDDATGASIYNADSSLEYNTGQIEATVLLDQQDYDEAQVKLAELNFDDDFRTAGDANLFNDLKAALAAASDGDTIVFDSSVTINFTSEISTSKAVNFRVDNGADVIFDGQDSNRVLRYNLNGKTDTTTANGRFDVSIEGVTFQNGNITGSGGALFVNGANLTHENVIVKNISATSLGGGLFHRFGDITVRNSTFTGNSLAQDGVSTSSMYGGAIFTDSRNGGRNSNWDVQQVFTGNTISNNSITASNSVNDSRLYGGGLYIRSFSTENNTVTLTDNTVTGNSLEVSDAGRFSRLYGGGIAVENRGNGSLVSSGNTITGNNLTSTDSVNRSFLYGGGVFSNTFNSVSYTGNTISANTLSGHALDKDSDVYGGAIYNNSAADGTATFTNNTASSNEITSESDTKNSRAYGGAFYSIGLRAEQNFVNNTAELNKVSAEGIQALTYGGAAFISNASSSSFSENDFDNNELSSEGSTRAYAQGGAVYNSLRPDGESTFTDNEFDGNKAQTNSNSGNSYAYGGAIFSTGTRADLSFSDNTISNNLADSKDTATARSYSYGGGVFTQNADDVNFSDNTVTGNSATSDSLTNRSYSHGGGLYNRLTADGKIVYDDNTVSSNLVTSNSGTNTSYTYGGGIYTSGTRASATYTDNTVEQNKASSDGNGNNIRAYGGGIFSSNPNEFTFTSNNLISNTAESLDSQRDAYSYGGSLFHTSPKNQSAVISGNTLTDNKVTSNSSVRNSNSYGGAVYLTGASGSSLNVTSNTASGNHFDIEGESTSTNAAGFGGTFYISSSGLLNFTSNTVSNSINTVDDTLNATGLGGALYINSGASGEVNLTSNTLTGNSITTDADQNSTLRGGGAYLRGSSSSTFTLNNINVNSNTLSSTGDRAASALGGGVYSELTNLSLTSSVFNTNTASSDAGIHDSSSYGGGFYTLVRANGEATINNNVFNNNDLESSSDERFSRAYGGGLFAQGSGANISLTVTSNTVDGNEISATVDGTNTRDSAAVGGGAYLYTTGSESGMSVTLNKFNNNSGSSVSESSVNSSDANAYGGGLYALFNGSKTTPDVIKDNQVTNNTLSSSTEANGNSRVYGGGLLSQVNGSSTREIQVLNNSITKNTATSESATTKGRIFGGAYYNRGSANTLFTMANNTISDTNASITGDSGSVFGGGVYLNGSTGVESALFYNTIVNNTSSGLTVFGDGVFNNSSDLVLWGNIINYNSGDGQQYRDNRNIAETGGNNLIGNSFRYTALTGDIDSSLAPNISDVLNVSVKVADGLTPLFYSAKANSVIVDAVSTDDAPATAVDLTKDQLGRNFFGLSRDLGAVEFIPVPVDVIPAGQPFVVPNRGPVPSFTVPNSFGVKVLNNSPGQFRAGSLNFLFAGSSIEAESLGVVGSLFDGRAELETEVADTGNVEQEVIDQDVYDTPQLPSNELLFIDDIVNEEEEEAEEDELEEVLFESSGESIRELAQLKEVEVEVIAQKDLDERVNLEDTLIGEFDCFKV